MRTTLLILASCSLLLVGCHERKPCIPFHNVGLTGFSTAYTLQEDENPAIGVSRVVSASQEAHDILSSPRDSKLVEDPQLGNYRVQIPFGGATILSPRHLSLTDHQILWQDANEYGTIYLHNADPSLNYGKIIKNEKTIAGGLTLFELDFPLRSPSPILVVKNPHVYRGRDCLIPISRVSFLRNNHGPLPTRVVYESDDMLFVYGKILNRSDRIANLIDNDYLTGNNFTIRIEADISLDGASGFPVLVYDESHQNWAMLATIISGRSEIFQNRPNTSYLHASRMSDDMLEKAQP